VSRAQLELPLFVSQREHLLKELQTARQPNRILLFEGAPGIGKGSALRHWCSNSSLPSYYIQLRSLHAQNLSNYISRAMGIAPVDHDRVYTVLLDSLRDCGLLVIDDLQVLFDGISPLVDVYPDMPQFFNWILECQHRGIDIVLCSSQKSVLVAMKQLNGYNFMLNFCSVDSVQDELVVEYLVECVNPTLKIKFTRETAIDFVEMFSGNLDEVVRFKQLETSVAGFIVNEIISTCEKRNSWSTWKIICRMKKWDKGRHTKHLVQSTRNLKN
jgi:hypothetical protein